MIMIPNIAPLFFKRRFIKADLYVEVNNKACNQLLKYYRQTISSIIIIYSKDFKGISALNFFNQLPGC